MGGVGGIHMKESQHTMNIQDLRQQQQAIVARAKARGSTVLNDQEDNEFRDLAERIEHLERRGQLHSVADNIFAAASAKSGKEVASYRAGSEVYNERAGHDFMRDLLHNAIPGGSVDARKRVAAYQEEQRDVTGMSAASDAAGSFTIPAYLESIYSRGLHPARPFFEVLPKGGWLDGVNSYNIPAVTTPTAVGTQTEFADVTEQDIVSEFITSQIQYIAGTQVYSRQIVDQSPLNITDVIVEDLGRALGAAEDVALLSASGGTTPPQVVGLSHLSGTHTVPTTGQGITDIYRAITLAKTYIEDSRFADPDVLLLHPRMWNDWVGTLFDTTQRPQFAPSANAYNPAGVITSYDAAAGEVAQLLGLRVVTDVNLSSTAVYVLRSADFILWASGPRAIVDPYSLSGNLALRVTLDERIAMICRYPSGVASITGFTLASGYGS
jgi:HK97 family phage major capsid protein